MSIIPGVGHTDNKHAIFQVENILLTLQKNILIKHNPNPKPESLTTPKIIGRDCCSKPTVGNNCNPKIELIDRNVSPGP